MAVMGSTRLIVASSILGLCYLAVLGYLTKGRSLPGLNDFVQLYVGATLLGDDGLYSPEANARVQLCTIGAHQESVNFSRLPFYALLLKPLSWLPYQTAYAVFQGLSFVAVVVFLWIRTSSVPELVLFASFSIPLLASLVTGQDVTLVLMFTTVSVSLATAKFDFAAGLILSMCLIKPHLFVLVPIALIAHRRWRYLCGWIAGSIVWLVGSTLAAGPAWLSSYLMLLRNPVLHPRPDHMPNIHGLVHTIGGSVGLEIVLCVIVAAVYSWFAFRSRDVELAFAIALVASLLLSYHAYLQDCTVLLLTFSIIAEPGRHKILRTMGALIVAPPVYLLLLAGSPVSVALPVALLALLGAAAATTVRSFAREAGWGVQSAKTQ